MLEHCTEGHLQLIRRRYRTFGKVAILLLPSSSPLLPARRLTI